MSASDFTLSMILVFERSFAVGFCPSIQMYSAVIFAKGREPPSRGMAKDRRTSRRRSQLARPTNHDRIPTGRIAARHRRVGASQQLILFLFDGKLRGGPRRKLGHADGDGQDAA